MVGGRVTQASPDLRLHHRPVQLQSRALFRIHEGLPIWATLYPDGAPIPRKTLEWRESTSFGLSISCSLAGAILCSTRVVIPGENHGTALQYYRVTTHTTCWGWTRTLMLPSRGSGTFAKSEYKHFTAGYREA